MSRYCDEDEAVFARRGKVIASSTEILAKRTVTFRSRVVIDDQVEVVLVSNGAEDVAEVGVSDVEQLERWRERQKDRGNC